MTGGMHENPFGVPKDEIVRMILEMPPEVAAQVIFGKYVESSGLVFSAEVVQRMFDRRLPRVLGNAWADQEVLEQARGMRRSFNDWGSPFHTGVDVARQTDYTVISTLDCRVMPARLVYYKRLNRVPWEAIYAEIGKARAIFGPNVLLDSTGMGGDVVMDALESRHYCEKHHESLLIGQRCLRDGKPRDCRPEEYHPLSVVEGYAFSTTTKKQLVEHLRNCLSVGYSAREPERDFGWLRTPPIVQLEEELSFYSWDDKGLDTDCLFSLCLAAWSGLEDPIDDASFGSVYGQ